MPVAHPTWTGCTTDKDSMSENSMESSGTISKAPATLSYPLSWWFDRPTSRSSPQISQNILVKCYFLAHDIIK